jgi:hypothetical protein
MLTIDLQGARKLLKLLRSIRKGQPPQESELEAVMSANSLFVDFYSRWEGLSREKIAEAMLRFDQPAWHPSERLLAQLAEGFRQALDSTETLNTRLEWLSRVKPAAIASRVLTYLPPNTPLDSTIHITVDSINNAFVHRGQMGVSLLKGVTDRQAFERVVAHELHHIGFRFWAERDPVRMTLLQEQSGRGIAVQHVQNLLAEGMANYFCTPEMVFREEPDERAPDPFEAKLGRLHRQEANLFAQAEKVLAMSLDPEADFGQCRKAFVALALDMEECLLPAAHYLGARMVQRMDQAHSVAEIVGCVQNLPRFLLLYNQAAQKVGGYVHDPELVDRFGQLWESATATKE